MLVSSHQIWHLPNSLPPSKFVCAFAWGRLSLRIGEGCYCKLFAFVCHLWNCVIRKRLLNYVCLGSDPARQLLWPDVLRDQSWSSLPGCEWHQNRNRILLSQCWLWCPICLSVLYFPGVKTANSVISNTADPFIPSFWTSFSCLVTCVQQSFSKHAEWVMTWTSECFRCGWEDWNSKWVQESRKGDFNLQLHQPLLCTWYIYHVL